MGPRREAPPWIWIHFCTEWLTLSRHKSDQWWQALTAARWSRAVAVRSAVLTRVALPQGADAMTHLVQDTLSPTALVAMREDLITEGHLAPVVARRMEEAVLRKTDRHGHWK